MNPSTHPTWDDAAPSTLRSLLSPWDIPAVDVCPGCGEQHKQLAQHFYWSPGCRPELSEEQKAVASEAHVNTSNATPRLMLTSVDAERLERLNDLLGYLGLGVSLDATAAEVARENGGNATAEGHSPRFRLLSRGHPEFGGFQ